MGSFFYPDLVSFQSFTLLLLDSKFIILGGQEEIKFIFEGIKALDIIV